MWCRHCQQDTPAVAAGSTSIVQCARCERAFAQGRTAPTDPTPALGEQPPADPAVSVEPWAVGDLLGPEDEQRLQSIGRQLRSTRGLAGGPAPKPSTLRFDGPATPHETRAITAAETQPPAPAAPRVASKTSQAAAWLMTIFGALVLGAGLGILGWSLLGGRPELWDGGLAATLAGQGLVIVGLVQLLGNLWTAGRDATGRLVTLHYEIRKLQRTADGLLGLRTATPSAFYADLSRGASPQVLMANLKGQVDAMDSKLRSN